MWEVNGDQMGGHCATEQKQLLFCFPLRVGYAPRELFCSVGWAGSRRLVCRTAGGSKRVLRGGRWELVHGVSSHPCTSLYLAQVQPVATARALLHSLVLLAELLISVIYEHFSKRHSLHVVKGDALSDLDVPLSVLLSVSRVAWTDCRSFRWGVSDMEGP